MFGWLKKSAGPVNRHLVGDLDLLERKTHFVRYQGKDYAMPELTARQYAEFCALMQMLEQKTGEKDPEGIDGIYEKIFGVCIPGMPKRVIRQLPLADAHALFVYVLKRHGIETEKKTE